MDLSRSLAKKFPKIAKQWHPELNGDLKPTDITYGSTVKVWWICSKDHIWEASANNRTRSNGSNCPYCAGNLADETNSLFVKNPELSEEWHRTKNVIKPTDVKIFSNKKVWWQCRKNKQHEWQAVIYSRTNGSGCPQCNGISTSLPEFILLHTLNKIKPNLFSHRDKSFGYELDLYSKDLNLAIEYDGCFYHKNVKKDTIKNKRITKDNLKIIRLREYGLQKLPRNRNCKTFNLRKNRSIEQAISFIKEYLLKKYKVYFNKHEIDIVKNLTFDKSEEISAVYSLVVKNDVDNSISKTHSHLISEWHPELNGNYTPDNITAGSNKAFWWKCKNNSKHIYSSVVSKRTQGQGCPYCAGKKIDSENSLFSNKKLVREWHPTKNELTPNDFTHSSNKKVWWKCEHGHEWEAIICSRSRGTNCPYCSNVKVSSDNSLLKTNPTLSKEWHPTKNGALKPSDKTGGSDFKAWWKCKHGHEWKAVIFSRSRGTNCPYCAGQKANNQTNIVAIGSKIIKEWNHSKNTGIKPQDFLPYSSKKVWWKCKHGHEWEATIRDRSRGRGCKICYRSKDI